MTRSHTLLLLKQKDTNFSHRTLLPLLSLALLLKLEVGFDSIRAPVQWSMTTSLFTSEVKNG